MVIMLLESSDLLLTTYYLRLTTYYLLLTTYYLLLTTYYLLLTTYYLLLTTYAQILARSFGLAEYAWCVVSWFSQDDFGSAVPQRSLATCQTDRNGLSQPWQRSA